MSGSRLPPVVAKELEDCYKAKKDTPKFFKKFEEEGYKMVLFQVPKDLDLSTLEGTEINLNDDETQVLNEEQDGNLVLEKVDNECEGYLTNQILPLLPTKNGKLGVTKKIAKTFRIYTRYGNKKIHKKSIIRQVPLSLINKA